MALTNKLLGQAMPGSVLTDLYVVPPAGQATVSVTICNQGVFADTYRIALAPQGATHEAKHFIAFDTVVAANDSVTVPSLFLRAGDVIRVFASVADISFTAMGTENT